jgi:hypothetical protein
VLEAVIVAHESVLPLVSRDVTILGPVSKALPPAARPSKTFKDRLEVREDERIRLADVAFVFVLREGEPRGRNGHDASGKEEPHQSASHDRGVYDRQALHRSAVLRKP